VVRFLRQVEVVVLGDVERAIRAARAGFGRVRLFEEGWERVDRSRERVRVEGLEGQVSARHAEAWRVMRGGRRSSGAASDRSRSDVDVDRA